MSKFSHLDDLLSSFVKNGPAGCGCAIAKEGKVLYEGYFGMADKENNKPITADSIYRLYSNTKVIICTAAMMLYERGKFLLDDPLYEYFPAYKKHIIARAQPNGVVTYEESKGPMLVKHAFTMAVGLPYPSGNTPTDVAMRKAREELSKKGLYTLQEDINAIAEVPIAFEPGTHFLYGFGHELVAGLIEVTSGKTVGQFLKEEIFEPLGMTSTAYRHFGDTAERMVSIYKRSEDGTLTKTDIASDRNHQPDAIYEGGGAGLFSTVGDYLKFTQMLANGGVYNGERIIGRKTIDLMRRNQLNEEQLKDFYSPYNAGYGYGLGVRTMMDPAAGGYNGSIGEFGWTGYLGTWAAIDPSEGFSAVYMHQMMPNMEEYFHRRLRAAAYGCI